MATAGFYYHMLYLHDVQYSVLWLIYVNTRKSRLQTGRYFMSSVWSGRPTGLWWLHWKTMGGLNYHHHHLHIFSNNIYSSSFLHGIQTFGILGTRAAIQRVAMLRSRQSGFFWLLPEGQISPPSNLVCRDHKVKMLRGIWKEGIHDIEGHTR